MAYTSTIGIPPQTEVVHSSVTIKQVLNFQCFLWVFVPWCFLGKNPLKVRPSSPGGWPWGTRHGTLDAHGLQSYLRMDGCAFGWNGQPNGQVGLAKLDSPEGPGSKIMDMIMILCIKYCKVYWLASWCLEGNDERGGAGVCGLVCG